MALLLPLSAISSSLAFHPVLLNDIIIGLKVRDDGVLAVDK